jgi:hypothetical protein
MKFFNNNFSKFRKNLYKNFAKSILAKIIGNNFAKFHSFLLVQIFFFLQASSYLHTFHQIDPSFKSFYIIYITRVLKLKPHRDASLAEILYGYHQYSRSRSGPFGTGSGSCSRSNATKLALVTFYFQAFCSTHKEQ